MRNKVKIRTKKDKVKTLLLSKKEEKELESELKGHKDYIQEYETKKGKIITDSEIVSKFD